jgi:hypothetical protein
MKKNIMSPFYIGLIVMSAFLLKNLQSLYVHALIGSVVVYAVIKLFRTLKDKVLITLTIVFFAVYCYSWYELTKPQLVQFVDFMTSYQNGMCRADSAGYAIYSDKVFEMIRRGDIYIAGIIAAYFKGLAHVLFSPFPWQITSSNQFFAYPQVVLWYCLLIFSIYGFAISFKNNPVKAAIAFLYLFLGISILALWEGNVGAAFRHRDYFAPIIFIFSSGAITKIYHKTTGDR